MRSRPLGKTGLRVTELALGTWGLSGDGYGPVDEAEQERVLQRALEMGFSLVDTADAYGGGRMEQPRRPRHRRPDATWSSSPRAGPTARPRRRASASTAPFLRESLERSLRRLGRDRVDVYLLHNPSADALRGGEAVDTLMALKAEGKIGHWGVSVGDVEVGREALRCQAEVIELAYNLFHGVGPPPARGRDHRERRGRARAVDARVRPARGHAGERTASFPPATTAPTAGRRLELERRVAAGRVDALPRARRRDDDARGRRPVRPGQPHRVDAPCSARAA